MNNTVNNETISPLKRIVRLCLPLSLRKKVWYARKRAEQNQLRREQLQKFKKEFKKYQMDPLAATLPGNQTIDRLISIWDNAGSARKEYLIHCIKEANSCQHAILECGSGLSTLIVAPIAEKRGIPLVALENCEQWRQRGLRYLRKLRLKKTALLFAPLREYDEYQWYDIGAHQFPPLFDFVICDGPIGKTTKGGRYGVLPIMENSLIKGTVILLDDAQREGEQQVISRWRREATLSIDYLGGDDAFALIRIEEPFTIHEVRKQ